ncbi:MAG: hypothetical protein R3F61_29820 [Myxococcota bacterium]
MTLSAPDSVITEVEVTETLGGRRPVEWVEPAAEPVAEPVAKPAAPALPWMAWVLTTLSVSVGLLGMLVAVWSGVRVGWSALQLVSGASVAAELGLAFFANHLFVVAAIGMRGVVGFLLSAGAVGAGVVLVRSRSARLLTRVAAATAVYLVVFGLLVGPMDTGIAHWAFDSTVGGVDLMSPVSVVWNVIPSVAMLGVTVAGLALWGWMASASRTLEWSLRA